MAKYRVNQIALSPNYDHEVHKEGCPWWPRESYIDLGEQPTCHSAVAAAKLRYPDANGCATCCPECHKG